MSAVLAYRSMVTRSVPLTEAVEFNPKTQRGSMRDDLEVSFVPMAAVEAGSGRMDPWQVRPYGEVKKGFTYFRDGDVLFAKITPCMENGKMAVAQGLRNGTGFGSTEFHVLRPRAGVDARYVYHFVSSASFRREAAHHMTGAVGQKRVPLAFLQQSELPLPPIHEQRRIVAEIEKQFSRLDEAVASLQRVKANIRRYKAALLKAAVEGSIVESEAKSSRRHRRDYETGATLLRRVIEARQAQWTGRGKYKAPVPADQPATPGIPDGWTWATLDQLTVQIADVDHKMPKATESGVPYVSTKDFTGDGGIDFAGAKRIALADYEALCRKVTPTRGDILLSRYGTIGEVRVVAVDVPFQASYSVAILKPVRGFGFVDFIAAAMRSEVVQAQIKRDVRATAQPDLGLAHIRQFIVPLPPLAEQHRIVAEVDRRLSIVREVEAEVDANLRRAQALRQAVLRKAFAG